MMMTTITIKAFGGSTFFRSTHRMLLCRERRPELHWSGSACSQPDSIDCAADHWIPYRIENCWWLFSGPAEARTSHG